MARSGQWPVRKTGMSALQATSTWRCANSYFYPDVFVTCSEADRAQPLIKQEPTLREIALIDPDARSADVYRCGADGLWVLHPFDPGQGVAFASVDLRITDDVLYADVD
jgi:Uma2 family endonuclease